MKTSHWLIAALLSWGIALFEYLIRVSANRIGSSHLTVGQRCGDLYARGGVFYV